VERHGFGLYYVTILFKQNGNAMKPKTELIEMMVDGMPLEVKATPYIFNDETRYRVSFNGSPVHIFAYDDELKYYRAIDSGSADIPDSVDEAIGRRLTHRIAA
jgi:hypothetical protein